MSSHYEAPIRKPLVIGDKSYHDVTVDVAAPVEGREVKVDEFQTACSAACSTGAMVFGDVNNKESQVAKLAEDKRMYHLLESVGTKPNVFYHVKVRNT